MLAREVYQASTLLETYRYTWGPDLSGTLEGAGGVGGLLAVERAVGSSTTWDIRHAHADANGNILALTTSTGQVSARYRYSPFGETLTNQDLDSSGWATKNIHRYSTKPEIAGTGLLYYGYRYYEPQTGRWPSRDPIEEKGGVNLYGFVGNDGLDTIDFLGKETVDVDGTIEREGTQGASEAPATGSLSYTYSYERECNSANEAKFTDKGIKKFNASGMPDSGTVVILSWNTVVDADPSVTAKSCPSGQVGTIQEGKVKVTWSTENSLGPSYKGIGIPIPINKQYEGSEEIDININCCCDE